MTIKPVATNSCALNQSCFGSTPFLNCQRKRQRRVISNQSFGQAVIEAQQCLNNRWKRSQQQQTVVHWTKVVMVPRLFPIVRKNDSGEWFEIIGLVAQKSIAIFGFGLKLVSLFTGKLKFFYYEYAHSHFVHSTCWKSEEMVNWNFEILKFWKFIQFSRCFHCNNEIPKVKWNEIHSIWFLVS